MIHSKSCSSCKNILELSNFGVDNSKKDKLQIYCRGCKAKKEKKYYLKNFNKISRQRKIKYKNNPHKKQKTNKEWYIKQIHNPVFVDTPQMWYLKRIKQHAKARKDCSFNITYKQLIESYSPLCALSNKKLYLTKTRSQSPGNQNASLDRIDSSKGYEVSNIQWVDWEINHLKGNYNNKKFISLCREVARQFPRES